MDKAVYYVKIEEGSNPTYSIDFADETPAVNFTENATRISPEHTDMHYIHHTYEVPGNYVASVTVGNLFESISVKSTDEVCIQNPLGHKFAVVPDKIDLVPYPPGTVTFNSHLEKNASHSFTSSENVPTSGWANNVHARWFLSKPFSGNQLLLQSYGDYDVGKL